MNSNIRKHEFTRYALDLFNEVKHLRMKIKKQLKLIVLLGMLSIFFAACSIEKRHYRNGYYIQHTKANNSKLGQRICSDKERQGSRATDGTAKTTAPDSASLDVQITTIENISAGTYLAARPDNSTIQEIIPNENQTHNNKSVCDSAVKKTSSESLQGKVPGKQKKKPWLKIAVCSLILAVAFIPIAISSLFGAAAWLICGAAFLVNALIFSIISIGNSKRTKKTDQLDWRKAVATVIALVSGIGLIVYGFCIWFMIAFAGGIS